MIINISYYLALMLVSMIWKDNGKRVIAITLGLLIIFQILWFSCIILFELFNAVLIIKL